MQSEETRSSLPAHLAVVTAALGLALAGFQLQGCNTVSGVGQDIKATGGAIDNAASGNANTADDDADE